MRRIAVMGVEGAVNIIFRDALEKAEDRAAELKRLTAEYESTFANPYVAASRGYVDDVIVPSETRPRIIAAFAMLEGKRDRTTSDETESHTVVLRRHHNDDLCSPPTKTKILEGRSPVFWGASFPQKKSSFGERKNRKNKTLFSSRNRDRPGIKGLTDHRGLTFRFSVGSLE